MAARAPRGPGGEASADDAARFRGAGDAMHAVSRLLGTASDAGGPSAVAEALVSEARHFFRARSTILLSVAELEGRVEVVAESPARAPRDGFIPVAESVSIGRLLSSREPAMRVTGPEATALARALGTDTTTQIALLLPMHVRESVRHVLVLTDAEKREFSRDDVEVARAFADAAAAGLSRLQLAGENAAHTARQAALARAARTLNESLELNRVLVRICEEATSILGSDYANVFLGNASEGLRFEATYGLPPDVIGARIEPGEGLEGKCIERDEPMLTNDYQALRRQVQLDAFSHVRSSLAVPMHWDGEPRGAIAVGYFQPVLVTREDLALLEAFADLAAAACRNASAHAGLVIAARTDGLTGCLNHAAMHDALRRELERCRRTGHSLSLSIVDLDDFKRVNESQGHLAGDEVLRRVGHALRQAVRAYDLVARYGGDEFAIVAIDAGELEAAEVSNRAIHGIAGAIARVDRSGESTGATAGVAEWRAGESTTALIARADRALLYGKQQGRRGVGVRASELPEDFMPVAQGREPVLSIAGDGGVWNDRAREQTERLRKRTRQLALVNALGARVAELSDPHEIVDAAVDELHRGFEYFLCAVLRRRDDGYLESVAARGVGLERVGEGRWSQPLQSGLIGRCVRERRPVMTGDVRSEPDYRLVPFMIDVRSELCVPIWMGEEVWGAIDIEEVGPDAFDEDDARLVQTAADQIGSALWAGALANGLDQARSAAADALAAAVDARGGRPDSAEALERRALKVGGRLGMSEADLRVLRLGARFHDVGKLSLSDDILHKPAKLTPAERREVEEHPLVAERILSPFGFLDDVRRIVRHEHERWDGQGYPDGLRGEQIPLSSRVLLATSAYHAMLSGRPYREALEVREARAELLRCAGTQFDPEVIAAVLEVLSGEDALQEAVSESSDERQSRSRLAS
jgi:diguanylate cyclase (GGDEF)-like protein